MSKMGVTKKAVYRKSASKICCKESNFSLQAPFSRGERLIVLNASKELSWFGRLNQVLETTTMR